MSQFIPNSWVTVHEIVEKVFTYPPRKACSYKVFLAHPHHKDIRVSMFPYLISILINGAKKLFGNDIKAENITEQQFDVLKMYMLSLGYQVKHSYTNNDDTSEMLINIWFEPYSPTIKCNGHIVY